MPVVTTTVETPIRDSFRVRQVAGLFDLPPEAARRATFSAELPGLDEPWTIGAIVGPSGSGKTSLARAAYGDFVAEPAPWDPDAAVLDGFGDCSIREITQTLAAVGFGSPPAWLRPYRVLSNGERFRCDLARALLGGPGRRGAGRRAAGPGSLIVFDEFTSVVDRTVAKFGSAAVSKALRTGRLDRRFVAVACHDDFLAWLEPDWSLDLASGVLTRGRLRRPELRLEVVRCGKEAWPRFARHHYLSSALPGVVECYVATWEGRETAFCATAGVFGRRGCKRVCRVVTLPDYQGLGIGLRLTETVCRVQAAAGFRLFLTTSHPAMIRALTASPRWRTTSFRRHGNGSRRADGRSVGGSAGRCVASFEFAEAGSGKRKEMTNDQ